MILRKIISFSKFFLRENGYFVLKMLKICKMGSFSHTLNRLKFYTSLASGTCRSLTPCGGPWETLSGLFVPRKKSWRRHCIHQWFTENLWVKAFQNLQKSFYLGRKLGSLCNPLMLGPNLKILTILNFKKSTEIQI